MKKGFTLIELLAVIVILAIIALIATPIVLNIIKDSRESATIRSAENYMDAVVNAIATTNMKEGGRFSPTSCDINDNGNLFCDEHPEIVVEVDKEKPIEGTITFNKGKVVDVSLTYDGGKTVVADEKGNLVYGESVPEINTPSATTLCKAIAPTEQQVYNEENGAMEATLVGVQATETDKYALGAVYSCNLGDGARTFYVFKDIEEEAKVKLIMNENLSEEKIKWCKDGKLSACQADGANEYLVAHTSGWEALVSSGGIVELPDAQELADVIGLENVGENYINIHKIPNWLYANLISNLGPGYWTSSTETWEARHSLYINNVGMIYSVGEMGEALNAGVRPVIVIPKKQLSLE